MKKLTPIVLFFLLICSVYLLVPAAYAESPSLSVSPSIIQLDLSESSPSATLTYTNNSKDNLELNFSAQDFKDLEDGWQVQLLAPKDAANYKYGLSSWISFDKNSLTLSPGEKGTVEVGVDAARLTSGGHYATIQAEVKSENKSEVNINGVLSSLLFVRTSGGKIFEEAKINGFSPENESLLALPQRALLRFQNAGNIDLTPYGLITILDPRGRVIGTGILNEGSLITLPESIRKYETNLRYNSYFNLPGIYKLKIDLHFGKSNKHLLSETSFLYIGWPTTILLFVIFIGVILIIRRRT